MPEYIVKKTIEIEAYVVCGDKGTAEVLASCLDQWCVDLTMPLPGAGYVLLPRGSFDDRKHAAGHQEKVKGDGGG